MFSDLPRRSPLLVLVLFAAPAMADQAEDCRNGDLTDPDRLPACMEAIEAASDPVERADLLLWRGAIHKRAEDYEQAEADFAAAQALRPDWADPLVERAYLLKDQGDLDRALASVQQAWALEPTSIYAGSELMSFLADHGRWQACLELAPQVVALDPEDPYTIAYRGRCLAEGGDHQAAVADGQRAIELGLEDAFVHANLAWSLIEMGQPEEAVVETRAALALDPEHLLAHRHLIRALALTEGPQAAMAALEAAPADAAERAELANSTAWDLFLDERAAEGLPFSEAAVAAMRESNEPVPAVWDSYGHLLAVAGRPEEAAKAFLKATSLDPVRAAAYVKRLGRLGFSVDPADPVSLEAALLACAETRAACRLSD